MKRIVLVVFGTVVVAGALVYAQDDPIEKALSAAPRQMKEGATVISGSPTSHTTH